jgi:AraC family transcriptional regulator
MHGRAGAGPRVKTEVDPGERVLRHTDRVLLGQFRCDPATRGFSQLGRIRNYAIAFPRTAVWIRHEGASAFIADPSVATVYNAGQPYERFAISPEGDVSDWVGLSETMVRDIVRVTDPAASDRERPLRMSHVRIGDRLCLRQRRLVDGVLSGVITEELEFEEQVLSIVGDALAPGAPMMRASAGVGPRRLADRTRRLVMLTLTENRTLTELASELGASVFHVCRTFRSEVGMTVFEFRRAMRLRRALDLSPRYQGNLSALALDLGFSSHSHFTAAFHRAFGSIPSELVGLRLNGSASGPRSDGHSRLAATG